jgi:hypothetical protein
MDWTLLNKNIDDYILITRDNIDSLELGSYIKYIKDDKLINGGFLIKIINADKIVYTELLLKSNIIWKLRFIKYKIYMKNNKTNIIKKSLHEEYQDEISQRKKELDKEINQKILNININKNKYKINIDN